MIFRKVFSSILAACILAGSCITPASALDPVIVYGDVNLDSSVDVADAVMIARYYVEDWGLVITDTGKIQADVNLDGHINDEDLTAVLQYIAHQRTELGVKEQRTEQQYQAVKLTDSVSAQAAAGKEATQEFLDSQLKLTIGLFKGAAQDPKSEGKDVLISPLSISQALAMTANGADGSTKTELEKLLGDTLDMDALNQYYYDYTAKLTEGENPALHLANSIWFKKNDSALSVPEAFLLTTKNYYHADAFAAPFDNSTLTDINSWVKFHTHDMIPKLIDQMDPNWYMILINALAFESEWEDSYRQENVRPETFHAYDGDMTAELMFSEAETYLQDDKASGLIRPYKDKKYSFAAILPNEGISVYDYIDSMTPESLNQFLKNKKYGQVYTKIPKFKHDYSITLNDVLKKLGMEQSFSDSADFSKLNEAHDTCIDTVLHKTFIEVDEQGTKAAAVTGIFAVPSSVDYEPPTPKYVYLNRPFIYMILDNNTNLPVFIGYVLHPTAAEAEE